MECTFQVGDKVVCINNRWPPGTGWGHEALPEVGVTYTIREILITPCCLDGVWGERAALRLAEIVNPAAEYQIGPSPFHIAKREPAFGAHRFRPLVARKTDISIFKRMLTDASEDVKEPA